MAILLVAERGRWDMVNILVGHGADVHTMGEKYVCQSSKFDTTITGSSGQMALILAVEKGKWAIVKILVEHGANVNAKGKKYVCHSLPN